jgi:glycoside/pentoside/hexuronide:cation symporter, GPH family
MACMATLLFIFCFFTTTERVVHKNDRKPIGEQLGLLIHNDQWLILAGVCVIGTIGYVIRGSVAIYYAKYYLGGDARLVSAFITVGVVGNILSMVASTWITKKFCKIKLFRWSQIATFALNVAMFYAVKPGDVTTAVIFFFVVNFVVDLQGPVFWSAISEAVDYGEVKSGRRVAGMAFGGISWCQKMGMSLAAGMVGWLLTYYHYVADKAYQPGNAQDMFTLNGIALLLTIIPGAFHLAVGLLMYRYFITDKYYNEKIREVVTHDSAKLVTQESAS